MRNQIGYIYLGVIEKSTVKNLRKSAAAGDDSAEIA
jgi:hypothetical protein